MILSNYKRSFTLLIAGQLISVLGNGLSRFTIVWWLALQFNSGTLVAQQLIASTLPGIVLAPLIGPLVDRLPRKRAFRLAIC